jgi:hypothetical protein
VLKRWLIVGTGLALLGVPLVGHAAAEAVPDYIRAAVPQAELVGKGSMSYLFWDVYDAELFAPTGRYRPDQPLALRLRYKLELSGRQIAEATIEQMRQQLGVTDAAKLAAWQAAMQQIFPDVDDKTVLTGVFVPGAATQFFRDAQLIGTLQDPEFGRMFFDIWLNQKTSAPELRRALLGQNT